MTEPNPTQPYATCQDCSTTLASELDARVHMVETAGIDEPGHTIRTTETSATQINDGRAYLLGAAAACECGDTNLDHRVCPHAYTETTANYATAVAERDAARAALDRVIAAIDDAPGSIKTHVIRAAIGTTEPRTSQSNGTAAESRRTQ